MHGHTHEHDHGHAHEHPHLLAVTEVDERVAAKESRVRAWLR